MRMTMRELVAMNDAHRGQHIRALEQRLADMLWQRWIDGGDA